MGDWRTVQIIGSCSKKDVPQLKRAIRWEIDDPTSVFRCLSHTGGLAGLPLWPAEAINAVGNLAERDYTVKDVAEALTELGAVAPSLSVKVHCGGNYESPNCIATVILDNGLATINPPEIEELPEPPEGQWLAHFYQQVQQQSQDSSRKERKA